MFCLPQKGAKIKICFLTTEKIKEILLKESGPVNGKMLKQVQGDDTQDYCADIR